MTKPVLQLMPTPYRIRRATYKNAYSPTNSGGSFEAAYALRELVDPIPEMTQEFIAGASCESTYGMIIKGADGGGEFSLVNKIINQDRKVFDDAALASLSITPSSWRAVTAVPEDWMDQSAEGFVKASINPKTLRIEGMRQEFQTIEAHPQELLLFNGHRAKKIPQGTDIKRIEVSLLEVTIERPWFDLNLFKTSGWTLPGQTAGYVSKGVAKPSNTGVMPLVVTGLLVGQTIKVIGDVAGEGQAFLAEGMIDQAAIGPFPISDTRSQRDTSTPPTNDPDLYLIGVISTPIPASPQ
ncbi:MAG: hypothetical protein ACRBB0_26560 [Pelagimonas sp.]|uniref:hypothetical protein n=1 Tax=Pelagimonas sp. TaxID=2073170 RepID=UPI003D6AD536